MYKIATVNEMSFVNIEKEEKKEMVKKNWSPASIGKQTDNTRITCKPEN